jgi:hypothetical protein
MQRPVVAEVDAEGDPIEDDAPESQARVRHAVADVLLRQTGLVYGPPVAIYQHQAELPVPLAERLTVIGLYRVRTWQTTSRPAIDYAIAVRLLPDGRVEACLPEANRTLPRWFPYVDVTKYLAPLIARRRELQLAPEQLLEFLRSVLLEPAREPTLAMLMADDWRYQVFPQMQNVLLTTPNQLDLNSRDLLTVPTIPIVTPEENPLLRVIRLRERGQLGETPQYAATVDSNDWLHVGEVKAIRSAASFVDSFTRSPFHHYLSIGKLPVTARRQKISSSKHAEGGAHAFKHQLILEIVPFFLQPDDVPIQWARVPHFLRSSPGWNGGSITAPYPIHLGRTAIDDMLWILGDEG